MVAASSWMRTFGVLDSVVRPAGGGIGAFLSRNCCPATHILRRRAWELCGGYDESMRSGFEDWEFFLSMLETDPEAHIGIVEMPLIDYRTAPASSNVRSMSKRLDLMRFIIENTRMLTGRMSQMRCWASNLCPCPGFMGGRVRFPILWIRTVKCAKLQKNLWNIPRMGTAGWQRL